MSNKKEIEYYVDKHFEQGTKHYGLDNTILTKEQVLAFVSAKKKEGSMRYEPVPDKVWTYTSFLDYNSFIKERYPKPEKRVKTAEEIAMAEAKKKEKQSKRSLMTEKANSVLGVLDGWKIEKVDQKQILSKAWHILQDQGVTSRGKKDSA